jgi:hypothetical protein
MVASNMARTESQVPRWDKAQRILYFGNEIVKRFRVPAGNQEAILDAFERLGWPAVIDNPLPSEPGMSRKYRRHFTIGRLNGRRVNKRLEFFGNGDVKKIGWRAV